MQDNGFPGAQTLGQDGFSASLGAPAGGTMRAQEAARSSAACQMAARRVLELADNGDGTLTVVRCADPNADDLDVHVPVHSVVKKLLQGVSIADLPAFPLREKAPAHGVLRTGVKVGIAAAVAVGAHT